MEQGSIHSAQKLSRIPESPPKVSPLPPGVQRPEWSVMIPVYNCSGYLRCTLAHVLAQDPGVERMQIEVVDDGSTDADVRSLVEALGKGRVGYFRQPENLGSLRNFQTCLERARGHLIHILHGDDVVRNGFYSEMERIFAQYPAIGAGFCRYAYIDVEGRTLFHHDAEMDHAGILEDWLARLCERQRMQYVAVVVKREVYEKLGGFYGVEYGEDWEMWVRIAAEYPTGYTPKVLAEYRKHDASISGKCFVRGENMRSLAWVMQRIAHHLPVSRRRVVMKASRKFYAHYAIRVATRLWTKFKNRSGASAQLVAAWRMSRDVSLFYKILKLYTRMILNI